MTDLSHDPLAEIPAYRPRQDAIGNHNCLVDMDHVELDRHTYP